MLRYVFKNDKKGKVMFMSLFKGPMRMHIRGHKELTEHVDYEKIEAKEKVYIPLICGKSTDLELFVKKNDKVKIGTKLAQSKTPFIVPIYASVSGKVVGIEKRMHASVKPIEHLVIENDEKYESVKSFEPLDFKNATREELIEFMKEAGIIGLGGAGFPSYVKYQNISNIHSVLINAVECEPFITADYKTIFLKKKELLTGMLAMKKMAEAQRVVIAVKKTHPELITCLKEIVQGYQDIEVVAVPDVYPMGWERVTVREIFKKEYTTFPREIGVVVNNVATAVAFGEALLYGKAIVERMVTVSGNALKETKNVLVPIGVCVSDVIKAVGGYTDEEVKLIAGGPMMGKTVVNDQFVIDRFMNALTVLKTESFQKVACLRCGKCSDYCPAGLQPVRIAQANKTKDMDVVKKLCAQDCVECGLCTYICPSRLDVSENVRIAKRQLELMK